MSFNFGQFRRDQLPIDNYITTLDYNLINYQRTTGSSIERRFVDKQISVNDTLESQESYYIQVEISKINSVQDFTIVFKNSAANNNGETAEVFTVSAGSGTSKFEFIVTPNGQYNQIVFMLNRESVDYNRNNQDGTYGRIPQIDVINFGKIKNLVSNPINHSPLTRIGVQGPVGLLMVINGEPIKIGPTGIYEINNGYKITSFGVVIKDSSQYPDGKQYFILDYQY